MLSFWRRKIHWLCRRERRVFIVQKHIKVVEAQQSIRNFSFFFAAILREAYATSYDNTYEEANEEANEKANEEANVEANEEAHMETNECADAEAQTNRCKVPTSEG